MVLYKNTLFNKEKHIIGMVRFSVRGYLNFWKEAPVTLRGKAVKLWGFSVTWQIAIVFVLLNSRERETEAKVEMIVYSLYNNVINNMTLFSGCSTTLNVATNG